MFSSTTIRHFFSPVSILKSYVLQRSVNCSVDTSSHPSGLAGPQDLGSPLDQQLALSIRCRTGIMRRVTWRRLPLTSLVLTLTRRPDIGERGRGMKKVIELTLLESSTEAISASGSLAGSSRKWARPWDCAMTQWPLQQFIFTGLFQEKSATLT